MIGRLSSGEPVIDRPRSHVHGDVARLLPEVLRQVPGGPEIIEAEVDLGRVIGVSPCVATTDADEIVFAQRPGRAGPTRFVRGRTPEPCTNVTVALRRIPDGYVLLTAYIGRLAGPEPWDPRATDASRAYWATHAMIWGME